MGGIGDMSKEEAEKLEAEGAPLTAQQQADFNKSQEGYKPEQIGDPAYYTPLSDDQIRQKGGYFLMDPQWVAGGPWGGLPPEEMQSAQNRVLDIEEKLKSGTAFAWTDPFLSDPHTVATDGTPVGWFQPDEQGRVLLQNNLGDRAFAIGHGNGIVAGTIDPTYTVPGS